jgi:hypothetical protein
MIEREVAVFIRGVEHYFELAFAQAPLIGVPYLVDARSKIDQGYTGVIDVGGRRRGVVCVTAPKGLLNVLLMTRRDTDISHENMTAVAGELTNTIAQHAHRELGSDLLTSVAQVAAREPDLGKRLPNARFVLVPVHVRNHEVQLLVALQ